MYIRNAEWGKCIREKGRFLVIDEMWGKWRTFFAAITGHRDYYYTITTIIIIVIANYPIIVTIIIIVIEYY